MWSSFVRELLAYGAADGAFHISFAYTPQQLLRLPVRQRQALVAALRAAIYACLCHYVGSPLRNRSIIVGHPFLRVVAIGVAANLCASLARVPLRLWPEVFTLAIHSRPTVLTKDALYMLGLIPLAEELFYRHASARLSIHFSPIVGISLIAFFFASSHHDQSGSALRFFRSWVYSLVSYMTANSYTAPLLCHVLNNFSAHLLDAHIAALIPPPLPPLPRCLFCQAKIPVGSSRYNCTACPHPSIELCMACYARIGSHKRRHAMEILPVLDYSVRVPHSSSFRCTAQVLAIAFERFASRPCLSGFTAPELGAPLLRWRTYAEVWADVSAVTVVLRSFASNSRVLLCGGNSAAWVVSYLAVVRAGHVLCTASASQTADSARRVRPVVVLCDGVILPTVLSAAVDSLRMVVCLSEPPLVSAPSDVRLLTMESILRTPPVAQDFSYVNREPEELAAIVWTSGSSGSPKGVLWPDRILRNACQEPLYLYPLVAVDFTPPHHAFALRQTLRVLCNGGQLAIVPPAVTALIECVRIARPTFLGAPPAFWGEFQKEFQSKLNESASKTRLQQIAAMAETRLLLGNRLQVALCGGSASPPSLLAFLRECLAPAHVSDGYAATECGTVMADGRAAPDTDVWLDCREEGSDVGEICVYSPSLCAGYLDDPAATTAAFVVRDGRRYYRTGDLGQRKADGTIALVGRRAASFKLPQGEFINPERIESVLETSPYTHVAYVAWHAQAQKLIAGIVPSEVGLQERWGEAQYLDEIRRVAQLAELHPYETPHEVILERQPSPQLAEQRALGKKKPRALYAVHFDPIITRKYSSSPAALPAPPAAAAQNPFVRLPVLAALLCDVLGATRLSPSQSFVAHGGDSLAAARFVRRCQAELGAKSMSIASALQLPSLYAIESALYDDINSVSKAARGESVPASIDWAAELALPADFFAVIAALEAQIAPYVQSTSSAPLHLLLIGATGFLGPFLLSALLSAYHPSVCIYCIVRADSHAAAGARLRSAAADLKLQFTDAEWRRIRPLAGHVARPRFGLSVEEYAQLAATIIAVYHNAAQVHGMLPYPALWPTNVGGALEAARLSLLCGGKHLHLISSINVLNPAADRPEAPLTTAEAISTLPRVAGYPQTKIVAEALCVRVLQEAKGRALKSLSLHRPATISGSTLSGASNVHCFSTGVLCGLVRVGVYPAEGSVFPPFFLLTPVDFVAAAIAAIGNTQQSSPIPQVWHYVTSRPAAVDTLLSELRLGGYPLRAAGAVEWHAKVESMREDNMLYMFRDQLLSGSLGKSHHALGPQSSKTRAQLRSIAPSLQCPAFSSAVWRRYFAFLAEKGLLPPASSAASPLSAVAISNDAFFQLQEWYPRVAVHTPQSVWLTLTAADLVLLTSLRRALAAPPSRRRDEPYTTTLSIASAGLQRQTGAVASTFEADENHEERSQFIARLKALHAHWQATEPALGEHLATLLSALQLLLKRVSDPVLGCFVRLGSRSPKDSTLMVTSLSAPAASLPLATDPLLRRYWSMRVSTAHEALALFLTSSRVQQDIHAASLENVPVTVVARRFVAQDPYWEFRLFVSQGKLTAASAYYTTVYSAPVAARQGDIAAYLKEKVFPTLAPLIPRQAYTLDVVLSPALSSFMLVELNPPPPVADAALFSLNSPADAQRLLQGPFELRVVQKYL